MAVVSRRQPSALISTGLAAATVALNIAGAAADALPIAKQILNSAAQISAAAERIQKKREAMYTLVEKADIYATQIDIAVAGRVLDSSLQRRLERLYSVFLKIEALVHTKAGSKKNTLTLVWQNVVTKPNHAETLVVELEREIQLFQLLTGIQLSLVVDGTARAVDDTARAMAADAKYDGQFRILRDCDIEKLDVIRKTKTDESVVVWASARVKRQLMVIRYFESQSNAEGNAVTIFTSQRWDAYLENIKKVSTIHGSHPHIVRLYGRHIHDPGVVLRSGTIPLYDHVDNMHAIEGNGENVAVKHLRLAYKMLDASAYLVDAHGLRWVGGEAIVDENGASVSSTTSFEPILITCLLVSRSFTTIQLLGRFNLLSSAETGVVEQVHDSLHTIITQQLRAGNGTDRLQRVWDIIRQEQLYVACYKNVFPIISGDLSLSQELIARARSYFKANAKETPPSWDRIYSFVQHVLVGRGANIWFRIWMFICRFDGDEYRIEVEVCTHDDSHVRYEDFWIHIPTGGPLLTEVARAAGLPDDFEHSWDGRRVCIYSQRFLRTRDQDEYDESSESEGEHEAYDAALEGEASFDAEDEC